MAAAGYSGGNAAAGLRVVRHMLDRMPSSVTPAEFVTLGVAPDAARELARRVLEFLRRSKAGADPHAQVRLWLGLRRIIERDSRWRGNFGVHERLYRLAYRGRRAKDGPGPAWVPSPKQARDSNLAKLWRERGLKSYKDLHRWSVEHRDEFWSTMIRRLGIPFRTPPTRIRTPDDDLTHPDWLPGARLNIAEACLRANAEKAAILYASETAPDLRRVSYRDLHGLAARVANGLERLRTVPGDRIALYLPMTPESVGIYLGVILAGRCVVGIAETSAPGDFEKRSRIADAKAVFTVDSYLRDGKRQTIYEKVIAAHGPRAVVLGPEPTERVRLARPGDLGWEDFLSDREEFDPIPCRPSDPTNVLFSSGTTKDPKAIPWTHTTPIKAAADAHLHQDVGPDDVLAWPTSFGWMMGPWLTYASLVNGATMALYVGGTARRAFGEFVSRAGVTMLGVVPKLVRAWKRDGTMEGLEWGRIRRFSSTAEPSTPEEMLYLMSLAGYKPVIEYCGGTEIGGAYITGTLVQPCAPSMFTTPAMGLDFAILDEGRPAPRGEVFLIPPSIGLSNDLVNYDHYEEYFADLPRGPDGQILRRHGDQLQALGGGFYRHQGRVDDMININGVKTSAEEIRSAIANDLVADSKPISIDVDGSGQHRLVVFAVPRDPRLTTSKDLSERLRKEFQRDIKERLNPLLSHVEEVILVEELPQAGPGKTKTMKELRREYDARRGRA
jgi:acetyl-CoA synthetase